MARTDRSKRPPRPTKPDTLLSPDMRKVEAQCNAAIIPLDRLAMKMDTKWGVDRLMSLVSPDTAAKYGSALGRLNEAIATFDPDQCAHMAAVCMRGLAAMDREATEAGAEKPHVLAEYEHDGFHFAIIEDAGDWKPILEERPGLRVVTLREVAIALQATQTDPTVSAVKDAFPGGEVGKPFGALPKDFYRRGGDAVPFGEMQ